MLKYIFTCDRCAKAVELETVKHERVVIHFYDVEGSEHHGKLQQTLDICFACGDEVRRKLKMLKEKFDVV